MPSSDREVWGGLKRLKMSVDLLDDHGQEAGGLVQTRRSIVVQPEE